MWTFEALIQPAELSLRFTSQGFATSGRLTPQAALRYQQRLVDAPLAEGVPEAVRSAFRRLQGLQMYGVLEYDLFTVAAERSLFVADLALSARFMEWCGGVVHRRERGGEPEAIAVQEYEEVYRAFKGKDRLVLSPGHEIRFSGGFSCLLRWARATGLLCGQRNRHRERALVALRNFAAHPRWHSTLTPIDSARDITGTAELINRLWGEDTPGGRYYPAPMAREAMIIGWDAAHTRFVDFPAENKVEIEDGLTYIAVLAVPHDPGLREFHAQFEHTAYPAELLAGPADAATIGRMLPWLRTSNDQVAVLDRLWACEVKPEGVGPARRPEVAAAVAAQRPRSRWYLVRADDPGAATTHARQARQQMAPCPRPGPCRSCAAETVAHGNWDALRQHIDVQPIEPPDVGVPRLI